jgi:hypothetical protein
MRRGEVPGLRWQHVHVDAGLIRLRQQVQRSHGELHIGPVKTRTRNRDLPLTGLAQRRAQRTSAAKVVTQDTIRLVVAAGRERTLEPARSAGSRSSRSPASADRAEQTVCALGST